MADSFTHTRSRPTINDVAKLAAVAKSSVSHVLNTQPENCLLAPETRERILKAIDKLGYRPSWRAKSLTLGKTRTVGLILGNLLPEIQGMNPALMRACYEALLQYGYHMIVIPVNDHSGQSWKEPLLDQRVDGCIVIAHEWPHEVLEKAQIPTVLLNIKANADYPQVLADEAGGCNQAMDHLLNLGHQRISFFVDQSATLMEHYSVTERVNAYKRNMSRAGLKEYVLVDHGPLEDFIARQQLGSHTGPTAVICYSHAEAMKLLSLLWQRNLRVPQQISVIGFNDLFPATHTVPPLTVVAVPAEAMAAAAINQLMVLIDNKQKKSPEIPTQRVGRLPEQLIVRASTGPLTAPASRHS